MNEDDLYRTSTQFRFWSFTSHALADLRASTNTLAAQQTREAISRQRVKEGSSSGAENVDCLTVEEEQKLVRFYCSKAMDFADFCNFPTTVKATALQFLHRFYLTNSPMTYHPKLLMPCSIYLASKSENHYMPLSDFASKLPKTTPADVIAPEFLLVQGLRFTFEVHHPYRALEGGCMELHDMAAGTYNPPTGSALTAAEICAGMLALRSAGATTGSETSKSAEELKARVQKAHDKAGELLKTSAILSDAYLIYTPAQIFLAALLAADEPLGKYYIHIMFSATEVVAAAAGNENAGNQPSNKELRLLGVLKECIALLLSPESRKLEGEAVMKEVRRIEKKLAKCRNPETVDVGKAKAESGSEGEDERAAKKRKMERERARREENDVFGGTLK